MKSLCLLFLMLLSPSLVFAQQGYLEVTAPGNRLMQLAVAPPVPLGGGTDAEIPRTVTDTLNFDLALTGLFSLQPTSPAAGTGGIRPGDFSFAPWKSTGTDLLVKSGYSVTGTKATLEFRLYDVTRERELTAKRFSGTRADLRWLAHTFSDEILRAVTGEQGPFTSKIAFVSNQTGNKEIYLMDYDGHNVLRLTKNGSINLNPDFSPSGQDLIYTSYQRRNPDLYRRDIKSGAEAKLSRHRGINATASWAPDGNSIALAMSKEGNSAIYIIDKDGNEKARLTRDEAISVSPTWSPDGKRIAFVSDRDGRPQIFIMSADGSSTRRLTMNGSYNVSPRWSPKGDRIAYCRQTGGGFQIFTISPDGSNDTQLTSEGSNEHPRWSPDGRFITFSSKRGGNEAIYVMRADGTLQTPVYRGKGNASHPAWSPRW